MNLNRVKELIELMKETGIQELEMRDGDESIRINRGATVGVGVAAAPATMGVAPTPAVADPPPSGHVVHAQMVGTFYRAPSPASPPFTDVGERVREGDTVCIIESMKMMNEIKADKSGVIEAILVSNGTPVEYDQPLLTIADD